MSLVKLGSHRFVNPESISSVTHWNENAGWTLCLRVLDGRTFDFTKGCDGYDDALKLVEQLSTPSPVGL